LLSLLHSFPTRRSSDLPGVSFADRQSVNPDGLPRRFDAGNVSPMLSLLDNGVLGLAYGRPGIKVALSSDGTGHYWDQIVELVPRSEEHTSELQSRFDLV